MSILVEKEAISHISISIGLFCEISLPNRTLATLCILLVRSAGASTLAAHRNAPVLPSTVIE